MKSIISTFVYNLNYKIIEYNINNHSHNTLTYYIISGADLRYITYL